MVRRRIYFEMASGLVILVQTGMEMVAGWVVLGGSIALLVLTLICPGVILLNLGEEQWTERQRSFVRILLLISYGPLAYLLGLRKNNTFVTRFARQALWTHLVLTVVIITISHLDALMTEQKAGGVVFFNVGHYLTGSFVLALTVGIPCLAILVGS